MCVSQEQRNKFLGLCSELSPENLCCDGEISMTQARARERQIKREWRQLEEEVGRKVTQDEVWDWELENRKTETWRR